MEEDMALKVCQLCAVDFTVEKFLTPLIDGMERAGWQVTTVCSPGPEVTKLESKGYVFHTIPIARSMNPLKAVKTIFLLYKYFRQAQFDIIHVHTPVAALLARIAAKLACKSYIIYTAHGFYFHEGMSKIEKRFHVFLEKFAGRFTNLLFCQSSEDAVDAAREGIMEKDRIITIGNGVDVSKYDFTKYQNDFHIIRAAIGIPSDARVIGIVARMVKEKGYQEFLEASIVLKERHPDLYILLIGGKLESDHDKGIDEILKMAKQKIKHHLIDLGFRSDVAQLISVMDIFCLPSYREGLPRTIIEAMFMKKPVVATDIRGCREEVIHEKTGLLVPLGNTDALADALDYLLNNEILAREMGNNGFTIASEIYNEAKVVELQINTIKQKIRS